LLRCSTRRVEQLVASGELASVKVGRQRVVPRSVVEEYIDAIASDSAS
jgi:excisionase family DNA binding protein